jgi:hypothetical protein
MGVGPARNIQIAIKIRVLNLHPCFYTVLAVFTLYLRIYFPLAVLLGDDSNPDFIIHTAIVQFSTYF